MVVNVEEYSRFCYNIRDKRNQNSRNMEEILCVESRP